MNLKREGTTFNQRDIERYFELVNLTPVQVQNLCHNLAQLNINHSDFADRYLHQLRVKTRFSHSHIQECLSRGPLCNAIYHHIDTCLSGTHSEADFNNHVRLVAELNAHDISVADFLLCGTKTRASLLAQLKRMLHTHHINSARLIRDFEKWLTIDEHILRDIELNHQLEKLRQATSFKDELTNAYSKAVFLEELDRAFALCDRTNQTVTILHFDFNQLSAINHSYGFQIGDDVLKQFANVCIEQLRKTETIARDEDEFLILLPNTSIQDVQTIFDRLTQDFDCSVEVPATLSAGASSYHPDSELTLEQVLERTSLQLANAKIQSVATDSHKLCLDINEIQNNVLPFTR